METKNTDAGARMFVPLEKISDLKTGDVVRHKSGGKSLVVIECYGERATAVRNADITNKDEWDVLTTVDHNKEHEEKLKNRLQLFLSDYFHATGKAVKEINIVSETFKDTISIVRIDLNGNK